VLAFAHPSRPQVAWGGRICSPLLYWIVTAFVVFVVASATGGFWWGWARLRASKDEHDPPGIAGMAERRQVRQADQRALLDRAGHLRPSLSDPKPAEVGFHLGSSRGVACWSSVEDSAVLLGPPRSGKGLHVVIPMILDAPGAVITTSTRPDNLTVTLAARETGGRPVAVFDPQGLAPGVPSALRWSPIRGCERPHTALSRARALCADSSKGTENGNFWQQQTHSAVRCLLHAAALANRTPLDLYRWSLSPAAAKEAVTILVEHPAAAPAWNRALDAIISADQRRRDDVWAMVSNTFAPLADPQVLDAVSPGPDEVFDPAVFLAQRGTVYLVGTASGASATATLVSAFVEDVVETARHMAAASAGSRLDPPLALILDEAANYALPSLSSLMSEGGGTGITTLAVLQSLAQARDRWGAETAHAIWDAAIVKLVLGGGSNADDLVDLSRLIGERRQPERSESWSTSGRSTSVSTHYRATLPPDRLRRLPFGYGLLLLRSAPPILLTLKRWTDRPDAKSLTASRAEVEQAIRTATSNPAER
jgi:type IV secretory pathway TraG/TraD family ATPase VirD4